MAKLDRIVAKIFGETADPTGADPQIGQFGSASLGTYVGTGDVATIQSLPAWSNGWIDAVTPTQQFPTLPEMTGVHKVLSYHEAYLLQSGIPEWDSATTYYQDDFCRVGHTVYYSLQDENINHNPTTDTMYWKDFAIGANRELSNLEDAGEDRLHALKGYLESGKSYTDTTLYNDVFHYNHSTFDLLKFTVVGSPIITDDGIASGFNSSNYIQYSTANILSGKSWNILQRVYWDGSNTTKYLTVGDNNSYFRINALKTVQFNGYLKSDNSQVFMSVSTTYTTAGWYYLGLRFEYSTGTYTIYGGSDLNNLTTFGSPLVKGAGEELRQLDSSHYIRSVSANTENTGSIDLKQFSIYVDGYPAFLGNKTGSDTYTINNTTVTIPYTLSKTGSKIVDVAYRERVVDVYEQFGSANYYTIDEINQNCTLPMGEVYGFIEGKASTDFDNVTQTAKNTSISWGMPDWSRMVSKTPYTEYTATERGWINAKGYSAQGSVGVKINSNIVAEAKAAGSADAGAFACLEPVDIGDTYEAYKDGTNVQDVINFINFIPCKGDI